VARIRVLIAASCVAVLVVIVLLALPSRGVSPDPSSTPGPAARGVICGNAAVLTGPARPPRGAVQVRAGNDARLTLNQPRTTYWFAPGVHTLGGGVFDQIIPSDGDTYIGGPGAVISGQGVNDYAFTQQARDVKVEYLTITDFGAPGANNNQGVVNHDSGTDWTIEDDTIRGDAGAGVMLGSGDVLTRDCLTHNGQYGFSSYTPTGLAGITITDNEISYNDTYNWEKKDPGCGCSGGGKLWDTAGATITNNYVHNNENVGIWVDTDNSGIDISDNDFVDNYAEGVIYEISYNGRISGNTFIHNGVGAGPKNPSFPTPAVYISESGSDPSVGLYGLDFAVIDNVFVDNWSGVVLWEDSNRFCGPDSPENAGSLCTLVAPHIATVSTCRRPEIDFDPLFTDCRWRTLNVSVGDNKFSFSRSAVGNGCSASNGCGFNGLFSIWGSTAPYRGWVVPENISDHQNDHFYDNSYTGPWLFMAGSQGEIVGRARWTKGFVVTQGHADFLFGPQDAGSKFRS
jgi:parallel beta-helix repeat protein